MELLLHLLTNVVPFKEVSCDGIDTLVFMVSSVKTHEGNGGQSQNASVWRRFWSYFRPSSCFNECSVP